MSVNFGGGPGISLKSERLRTLWSDLAQIKTEMECTNQASLEELAQLNSMEGNSQEIVQSWNPVGQGERQNED